MPDRGEDAALVESVREGDVRAFEALYDKYKTMVFRTAYAIARDRFAAEEITQDCFVRAYCHIDKVDVSTSLGPWLHRIAVNLSYNWCKSARRRWLLSLEKAVSPEASQSGANLPAIAAQQGETRRILLDALESLGFEQRATMILFYLGGFSLEEIGYILDCPVGTVKSRLHYGRLRLKKEVERIWRTATEVVYEI